MRLGAPVFIDTQDPGVLARAHVEKGYRAAYCPGWLTSDSSDAAISEAVDAFDAADVIIAEVGAWCNCLHPDKETREKNIAYVISRLELAERVGARCCVDFCGSYSPDRPAGPHPDDLSRRAFDEVVASSQRIIDAVRPTKTVFALEMMQWAWPDSVDANLALLEAVDRPAFGVHLDVVNIVTSPRHYYHNTLLIRDCIDRLGPHIKSAHGKDCRMSNEYLIHLTECLAGTGAMDYATLLTELSRLPQDVPLMLEHLSSEAEYDQAAAYVRRVAAEVGIRL